MSIKVTARRHPADQLKRLITSPDFNEGALIVSNFAQASDTHELFIYDPETDLGYRVVSGSSVGQKTLKPGEIFMGGGVNVTIGTEVGDYYYKGVAVGMLPGKGCGTMVALPSELYESAVTAAQQINDLSTNTEK